MAGALVEQDASDPVWEASVTTFDGCHHQKSLPGELLARAVSLDGS